MLMVVNRRSSFSVGAAVGFAILLACVADAINASEPISQSFVEDDLLLQVEIDRDEMLADEQLRFTLKVEAPLNVMVEFEPVDEKLGQFDILQRRPRGPDANKSANFQWQREYVLQPEPEALGRLRIPSLRVTFFRTEATLVRTPCISARNCQRRTGLGRNFEKEYGDTKKQLRSEPFTVRVAAAKASDIANETPLSQPITGMSERVYWFISVVVLLVLGSAVAWWRRPMPGSNKPTPTVPELAPALAATQYAPQALQQLESCHNLNQLDAILRTYLFQQFAIPAPQLTSHEVLLAVKNADQSLLEQHESLERLLQHFDQIKFAAARPDDENTKQLFRQAKQFVEKTACPNDLQITAQSFP